VKEAPPYPVGVVFAQNGEHVLGLAVLFEAHAVLLGLRQEGDVGADGVTLPAAKKGRREKQRKNTEMEKMTAHKI
jgi:hypothetical protein